MTTINHLESDLFTGTCVCGEDWPCKAYTAFEEGHIVIDSVNKIVYLPTNKNLRDIYNTMCDTPSVLAPCDIFEYSCVLIGEGRHEDERAFYTDMRDTYKVKDEWRIVRE